MPEIQFSKRSQVHNDLLILINVLDVFQSGMARSAYAEWKKFQPIKTDKARPEESKHSKHIVSDDNGSSKK